LQKFRVVVKEMKFLHTMIRVRDIKKSLEFYEKLIGLKVVSKKRLEDCALYFLSDEIGEVQIELTYNDKTPESGYQVGTGFGHFAFQVESMDEITKKLKEMDLKYLWEPYNLLAVGSTISFVKDPDGYEIEFIQKN
jgi:lactoylglutathione lyase